MSRAAKPKKIEVYKHTKLGVSVDLCFDKNSALFLFELNGKTYTTKSMDELRTLAHREVEKLADVKWIPVIEVRRFAPFASHSRKFVGFTQNRFYIAKKADGGWIQRDWEDRFDDGCNGLTWANQFAGPGFELYKEGQDSHDSATYVIDYTEGAWNNLLRISDQIEMLRDRLSDLLMTKAGVERLSTMKVGKLLGSGDAK